MSNTIAFLEAQLSKRSSFLEESEKASEALPTDKATLFFLRSDDEQVKRLQAKLRIEKAVREREIFEMRLYGGSAGYGSLPLKLLGKYVLPISDAIERAAFRLHKGQESNRGVPKQLTDLLNLQFAGLEAGSARLMVTGNTAPDLAGASVLENTLRQLFRLFLSDEEFFDAVDAIGVKAAHKLSESFKALEDEGCGVDFIWSAPDGTPFRWNGSSQKITSIRERLESLSEPETLNQRLEGEISGLKTSGIVEIRSFDGAKHKIRYGMEQQADVAALRLWQNVAIQVRTERTYDQIAHTWRDKHHLSNILSQPN